MFDIRKFGAYISKLRKDSDMTQSMLADKLNLTRQTVSSYENGDFETLDREILEKFMPFLDDVSKYNLFVKIVDGEIDYHFLEIYLPYVDPYYVYSQIEEAVIAGTVDWGALEILKKAFDDYLKKHKLGQYTED